MLARWCAVPPMQECKRANVSYISPEHILLALLNQPDASGKRVLDRWAGSCSNTLCSADRSTAQRTS